MSWSSLSSCLKHNMIWKASSAYFKWLIINNYLYGCFYHFYPAAVVYQSLFCRLCFLKLPNIELRLLGAVASHRSGYTLCVFLFPCWNLSKQANGSAPLPMVLKPNFHHLKVASLSTRLSGYVFHILKSGAVVLWLDFLSPSMYKMCSVGNLPGNRLWRPSLFQTSHYNVYQSHRGAIAHKWIHMRDVLWGEIKRKIKSS